MRHGDGSTGRVSGLDENVGKILDELVYWHTDTTIVSFFETTVGERAILATPRSVPIIFLCVYIPVD